MSSQFGLGIKCPVSITALRAFYLQAMIQRLDHAVSAVVVPTMPGYMSIREDCGSNDLLLVDCFCGNHFGHFASGTVTISVQQQALWQPVWALNYVGHHELEVLPFLKTALLDVYDRGLFIGGRGPVALTDVDGPFCYSNHAENGHIGEVEPSQGSHRGCDFAAFHGFEQIRNLGGKEEIRGRCQYHGGLLVPKDAIDP